MLEDIKYLREENGIEESIITTTRTFKKKIINTFPEEISFYPNGKYLIVQSSNINPCHFIVAVLKSKGLKVTSAEKLFLVRKMYNERIFLFEENIRFRSLDI